MSTEFERNINQAAFETMCERTESYWREKIANEQEKEGWRLFNLYGENQSERAIERRSTINEVRHSLIAIAKATQ